MFEVRARAVLLMLRLAALALGLLAGAVQADEAAATQGAGRFRFAGYDKAFLIGSRTLDPADRRYTLGLNRTRLKLSYLRPQVEVQAENDTELLRGNYLNTAEFQAAGKAPRRLYWDLSGTWSDGRDHVVRNDFFRAWVKLSAGAADFTLGRQRIPLGTGRLWSALDVLNPLNPLQIERDEYVGVDAALLDYKLGSVSRLLAVMAPDPDHGAARSVLQWRTHVGESDLTFSAARYWGDRFAGFDFATQVGGLGLHGEIGATDAEHGSTYASGLLGLDYAFGEVFTVSLEAYASGRSAATRAADIAADPLRLQTQPYARRYFGGSFGWKITPLLEATLYGFGNLEDHSRAAAATLAWSVSDNVVLQLGTQHFSGRASSEYGRLEPLYYLQSLWSF